MPNGQTKSSLIAIAVMALSMFFAVSFDDVAHAKCVRGVASNDVLNIRSGPSARFRIVGAIAPGTCGVSVLRREGGWSYVDYGKGGFVRSKFLGNGSGGGQAGAWCVRGVAYNDVLNVRQRPTTSSAIRGAIGPDACGLRVLHQSGRWYNIRFKGIRGWVNRKFLSR